MSRYPVYPHTKVTHIPSNSLYGRITSHPFETKNQVVHSQHSNGFEPVVDSRVSFNGNSVQYHKEDQRLENGGDIVGKQGGSSSGDGFHLTTVFPHEPGGGFPAGIIKLPPCKRRRRRK